MAKKKTAMFLKRILEDDQLMEVYFLDPPIQPYHPELNLLHPKSYLVGFHFSPSEGGLVIQMWELDEQLRLTTHISFGKVKDKLIELKYDPKNQDVTPILNAFGYEIKKP